LKLVYIMVRKTVNIKKNRFIKKLVLIQFFSFFIGNLYSQTVSFTTSPAAIAGSVSACSGSTVTFTDNSTGIPGGSDYNWTFPGGVPGSITGIGPHAVTFPVPGNYTAQLEINGDTYEVDVEVIADYEPVLSLNGTTWTVINQDGVDYITRCGAASSPISFAIQTDNQTTEGSHQVVWGNGNTTNRVGVQTGNVTTTYTAGIYTISYTYDNGFGCASTTEYNVFIGQIPNAGLEFTSGSICNPGAFEYQLTNFASNPNGTTYTVTFTDGSPPVVYNHVPPAFNEHFFQETSCGADVNNQFFGSLVVSNVCGQSQIDNFGPITVSHAVEAEFDVSHGEVVCVEVPVQITDQSVPGESVSPAGCLGDYAIFWRMEPQVGYTINSGVLGDDGDFFDFYDFWNEGSPELDITFHVPGIYEIALYAGNSYDCGVDSIIRTICVVAPIVADFSLDETSICTPYLLTPDNNSSIAFCDNSNVYEWTVFHDNPENCPNTPGVGPSYENGTANDVYEPDILLTSPGVYTIQLVNRLLLDVPGPFCEADTMRQTITIKDAPFPNVDPITLCEDFDHAFVTVVDDCYGEDPITYLWDFSPNPPASITTSTDESPVVSYNAAGDYTYEITVTNECGSTLVQGDVTIDPGAVVLASGPAVTCLNNAIQLSGDVSGGSTTGTWTSSVGGTFDPSATDLNPLFTPPLDFTGELELTLTSGTPAGPCPAASVTFTVDIQPEASTEAGDDASICQDEPYQLNGSFAGAASSITWTSLNGGSFDDPTSPTAEFTPDPGFFGDVTLVITTDDPPGPCEEAVDQMVLTVIQLPEINAGADEELCQGGSLVLDGSFGGSATSGEWQSDSGGDFTPNNNDINATWTPDPNFTGTATLTYTSISTAFCAEVSDDMQVEVFPIPFIENDVLSICSGETINYTPSSDPPNSIPLGSTYTWTVSVNADVAGQANSMTDEASINQTLTNLSGDPQVLVYTITPISGASSNCSGDPFELTVTINPWSFCCCYCR
jgi:large repetitive protein